MKMTLMYILLAVLTLAVILGAFFGTMVWVFILLPIGLSAAGKMFS